MRIALAALAVFCATAGAARAQVLVIPERDLAFGLLTPGSPTTVAPADVIRSAQLRVEGRGTFQVSFQLPSSLTSVTGQQIPLVFGAAAATVTIRRRVTAFDPVMTTSFRLTPGNDEAVINLGGEALPPPGQTAGSYTATIVVMIIQTGT